MLGMFACGSFMLGMFAAGSFMPGLPGAAGFVLGMLGAAGFVFGMLGAAGFVLGMPGAAGFVLVMLGAAGFTLGLSAAWSLVLGGGRLPLASFVMEGVGKGSLGFGSPQIARINLLGSRGSSAGAAGLLASFMNCRGSWASWLHVLWLGAGLLDSCFTPVGNRAAAAASVRSAFKSASCSSAIKACSASLAR